MLIESSALLPIAFDPGALRRPDSAMGGFKVITGESLVVICKSRAEPVTTLSRDVGPFRYWTLLQLPNFLLASPMLLLSFATSYTYYSSQPRLVVSRTLPFLPSSLLPSSPTPPPTSTRPFLSSSLLPFIHLHTATTLLLLISSHVQIILRLCIPNSVVWWYASDLLLAEREEEGRRRWGKRWTGYCVIWGTVATVLWALFLPPA